MPLAIPLDLPGAPAVYAIEGESVEGHYLSLWVGYSTSGAVGSYPTENTVTNPGTAEAWPIFRFLVSLNGGTATLKSITNNTTGKSLMFDDYEFSDDEYITIDLTPGRKSITSSYYGSILHRMQRGSDFASFSLLPGANSITVWIMTTGASIVWKNCGVYHPVTHWSADGAAN